jgi:hypothetical protein
MMISRRSFVTEERCRAATGKARRGGVTSNLGREVVRPKLRVFIAGLSRRTGAMDESAQPGGSLGTAKTIEI